MAKTLSTADVSVASFIMAHKVPIVSAVCVVLVALFAYIAGTAIATRSASSALSDIDSIVFSASDSSAALSEEELDARRKVAFSALDKYLSKRGVAGVRANMAAAELAFSKGEWVSAAKYWTVAAQKSKKSYTGSLCYFNAGVANENALNIDAALDSYKNAISSEDFLLKAHAQFSLGRLEEEKGEKKAALDAYQKLVNDAPETQWGQLAKTKVLTMGDLATEKVASTNSEQESKAQDNNDAGKDGTDTK